MKGVYKMIDVKTAIAMLAEKYPNKRIDGDPGEVGDLLVFGFVDKNATPEEAKWDNTVVGVNRITGNISWHSLFDEEIMKNAKPITEY